MAPTEQDKAQDDYQGQEEARTMGSKEVCGGEGRRRGGEEGMVSSVAELTISQELAKLLQSRVRNAHESHTRL